MRATQLALLPNWLGDLVMAEPTLRAMRDQGPVRGVVSPAMASLVEDADLVDAIEVYDRRGPDRGLAGLWRVARRLRGTAPQRAVVLGPSLRAAALSAAAGCAPRLGEGGEGRELFLHGPPRPRRDIHRVDTWTGLVGGASGALPRWRVGPAGRTGLAALEADLGPEPFAAYAVGAAFGATKRWPLEHFVEVARSLHREDGLRAVAVGGPQEVELAARFSEACGGSTLAGRTDLPTLAALLARARLFVGNDSGPMHLAAALGTPTVGIFGSTNRTWTAPRGPRSVAIGPAEVACSPCYLRECPFDLECLRGVEAAEVLRAARRQIRSPRAVVWLDRDGTLVDDPGYLRDPDALVLLPGAARAVARLNRADLAVILVTNQSGIGRGLMTPEDVAAVHARLGDLLAEGGGHLDAIYFCPHLPPEKLGPDQAPCDCRKPRPGMVLRSIEERGLEGIPGFVVGDKRADLELGRAVGARSVLVTTGEGAGVQAALRAEGASTEAADHVAPDVDSAVDWILASLGVAPTPRAC